MPREGCNMVALGVRVGVVEVGGGIGVRLGVDGRVGIET